MTVARTAQRMLAKQGFMVVRRPIEGSVNREIQRVIEQRRIATLIDVGAHEGRYGALWRAHGFKGRIVSFEPAPSTFERLRKRAGSGWETHQLAIGDEDGTAEFFEYAEDDMYASLRRPSGMTGMPTLTMSSSYAVTVRALDGLLAELDVDPSTAFLKIDTQGHDAAVLEGAPKSFSTLAGLQVEIPMFGLYEGAPRAETLIALIRDHGFDLIGLFPVHAHPRPLVPIEFDAMFVRAGEAPG